MYLISNRSGKEERVYYIRYRDVHGKPHFEKAGKTATTPAKAASVRGDRIRGKEPSNQERREAERAEREAEAGRWTFNRLWEAWKADPENVGKPGIYKDDNRYTKHLKDLIGNREPKDLIREDVDRLRLNLAKTHAKETTLSVLRLFKRISNYGYNTGKCPGIGFAYPTKDKRLGKEPRIKYKPTEEELDRWLKIAEKWPDPQVGNLIRLAYYNGIRRSSLIHLKWQDVKETDNGRGTAYLYRTKSGKDVIVPLIPEVMDILRNHPRIGGSPYVFSHSEGRAWTKDEIAKRVRDVREAAGLPECDPLHTFRRNLATTATKKGVAKHYTKQLGGWLSALVHKFGNVLFHAATRDSAGTGFILSRSLERSWRVNFHSNGFAIAS